MNAFLFAYKARIMARLRDDEPVELYRTRGKLTNHDINHHTRDLDIKVWTWWVEESVDPFYLISDRPKVGIIPSNGNERKGLALKHEEKTRLEHDTPRLSYWT
jgi:hypothetical protein